MFAMSLIGDVPQTTLKLTTMNYKFSQLDEMVLPTLMDVYNTIYNEPIVNLNEIEGVKTMVNHPCAPSVQELVQLLTSGARFAVLEDGEWQPLNEGGFVKKVMQSAFGTLAEITKRIREQRQHPCEDIECEEYEDDDDYDDEDCEEEEQESRYPVLPFMGLGFGIRF